MRATRGSIKVCLSARLRWKQWFPRCRCIFARSSLSFSFAAIRDLLEAVTTTSNIASLKINLSPRQSVLVWFLWRRNKINSRIKNATSCTEKCRVYNWIGLSVCIFPRRFLSHSVSCSFCYEMNSTHYVYGCVCVRENFDRCFRFNFIIFAWMDKSKKNSKIKSKNETWKKTHSKIKFHFGAREFAVIFSLRNRWIVSADYLRSFTFSFKSLISDFWSHLSCRRIDIFVVVSLTFKSGQKYFSTLSPSNVPITRQNNGTETFSFFFVFDTRVSFVCSSSW